MRNPKWSRDEIILALDLYHKLEPGQIGNSNPEVIKLSELLNQLPIHEERPDVAKFRNPNGVGLKLSNFLAIDPGYPGKGMGSYSKLDEATFWEFKENKAVLANLAQQIKAAISNPILNQKLAQVENEPFDDTLFVKEGRVLFKLHKLRERNSKINKLKKDQYLKEFGKLDCEVCTFDFYEKYGELGKGYIECHHKTPLADIDGESITSLKDLALVCSNCHRMLHREISTLSVDDLRRRIDKHH